MQVILMEKVVNLGGLGDVVKVKDGFARNFLIPQGKAKRATDKNLKEFENRRTELEKKANEQLTGAQERGAKLEGMKVDIAQKAGADGRLFGSVTNADIAEALGKQGLTVKKAEIRMPQGLAQAHRRIPDRDPPSLDVLANIVCTWCPSSRKFAPAKYARRALRALFMWRAVPRDEKLVYSHWLYRRFSLHVQAIHPQVGKQPRVSPSRRSRQADERVRGRGSHVPA